MQQKRLIVTALAGVLLYAGDPISAAGQDRTKDKIQTQTKEQERIYGSQLMTEQERNEYRQRMRNAKTDQERNNIRNEHHARMVARAKERGVTIPDEPPARGGGKGAGPGAMGPGGGMGSGPGGMGPGGGPRGGRNR
jgi:hypothetical protein